MKLTNLSDIPEFKKDYVHVKNEQEVLDKINKIIEEGHEKLQIVTDFDHTLTRHNMENGDTVLTSFGMFRECPSIPQYYKDEDQRLSSIYKPIESDPHMSIEQKTEHMVEWYKAAHAQLRGVTFPKQELAAIGHSMIKCFRSGASELVSWAASRGVPLLVLSAGLGDAVHAALAAAGFCSPNLKVVSNFLAVGEDGKISGIRGAVIHTLNKNETSIRGTEYHALVRARGCVLLMGDNIGDAAMADGLDRCDVALKVGLLGQQVAGNLPNYLRHFDVVLVGDPGLELVNAVLSRLH